MEPINLRAFYKPSQKIYDVQGIASAPNKTRFMISEEYVNYEECIILKSTEKEDSFKKTMYEGDIVQLLSIKNKYGKNESEGLGFIYFDKDKSSFMYAGFNYGGYPRYNLSGKQFKIMGNIFHNVKLMYKGENFNPHSISNKIGGEYYKNFLNLKFNFSRKVIIEKAPKETSENGEYKKFSEKEKIKQYLKNISISKKEENHYKIYISVKEKLENS